MALNPNNQFVDDGRFGPHRARAFQPVQGRQSVDVVIANGAAISAAVDLGLATALGVQMPAAWTAAGLYVLVSADGVTYGPVSDKAGTPLAMAVVASECVSLDREVTRPWRYLKLVSGAAGADVNQGAARTIKLLVG